VPRPDCGRAMELHRVLTPLLTIWYSSSHWVQMDLGRARDLAANMNPDSTDLGDRSRTAETARASKINKEVVRKNTTLCVERLGRRAARTPKNSAIVGCSGFVKMPKRHAAGYQVIVSIACRRHHGALPT
jgi:hypothetical protein